ncbi:Helix-turn-helix [Paenibacillus sp. yr247]|nr:Helix-turn-helix [Paenibacillus sp. yr247]
MVWNSKVGPLLKVGLENKSLSMRKLGTLTGIDPATISRIMNGKQQAKLSHLQQFALHLDLQLHQLLEADGYNVEEKQHSSQSDIEDSFTMIQNILGSARLFDHQFTTERVKCELEKYEAYAKTEEGRQIIMADFQAKVNQVNGAGPFIEQLKLMHERYCNGETSEAEKSVLGSGLLYFILSADIIPDYVFPIGYVDDALAVQLVQERLAHMKYYL